MKRKRYTIWPNKPWNSSSILSFNFLSTSLHFFSPNFFPLNLYSTPKQEVLGPSLTYIAFLITSVSSKMDARMAVAELLDIGNHNQITIFHLIGLEVSKTSFPFASINKGTKPTPKYYQMFSHSSPHAHYDFSLYFTLQDSLKSSLQPFFWFILYGHLIGLTQFSSQSNMSFR